MLFESFSGGWKKTFACRGTAWFLPASTLIIIFDGLGEGGVVAVGGMGGGLAGTC